MFDIVGILSSIPVSDYLKYGAIVASALVALNRHSRYRAAKSAFHDVRMIVDNLDTAWQSDTLTADEKAMIVDYAKKLVADASAVKAPDVVTPPTPPTA